MNNGSSSNPSDYQFLLRTLSEGNHVAKAQSLKRFNTLVLSDKKQFATYAKRIVIAIQELMLQQKEDINLLAGTLALQIINLNPRDIEFYIKTKLLKAMVINLGDSKPQIRKTSHYCLLAYVRMFKNFDDLVQVYVGNGFTSSQWQLRQKSINSFQSILVMQMKYLNWGSSEFKRIFELLLLKLKDQNGFVQKAAEQCLLSLSKVQEIRSFSKKLSLVNFSQLKAFCEQQFQAGNLNEIKLDIQKKPQPQRYNEPQSPQLRQNLNTVSLINTQKLQKYRGSDNSPLKQPQQEIFQGKRIDKSKEKERNSMRKVQSMTGVTSGKELQYSLNLRSVRQEREEKSLRRQSSVLFPPISNFSQNSKQEKLEQIMGKKVLEDLRNDKDWKVRLQAIEELQTKFQINKSEFQLQVVMKNLLPILIKLLGDANFKVALIALKVLQEILRIPSISLDVLVPQVVEKLTDNKVALRQNISKLIRSEYLLTKEALWIDNILLHVKKSANPNVKEEILNILLKFYEEGNIPYSFEKILETVYPLMDDLKTKIKIKTLDLLALVTIKSQKIDRAKNILATKLNQVYYEMYLEKIGKQLKLYREANPSFEYDGDKSARNSLNQLPRKLNKVGNTTSTSLQRFSPQKEQNSTVKTAFYESNQKMDSIHSHEEIETYEPKEKQSLHADYVPEEQSPSKKKSENRYMRRRAQKSVESRLSTTNYSSEDAFPPFADPSKEIKNILIELKSQDWQISNEALNKLHRIIIHHSELLVLPTLKAFMPDLMRLAESLRSTLSKNALVVLNELSSKVKKLLDTEFDLIFSKLIKKSLDTNSFISQEVKRALVTICSNCNETKVVTMLTNTHLSRAIPIKTAIVNILEGVAFLPKFYEKELERIVAILVDFMGEGSLQIREKTKNLLNSIIASERGGQVLKLIPLQHRNKLKKRDEPPSPSKVPEPVNSSLIMEKPGVAAEPEQQQQFPRRKKKNKITQFPPEFDEFDSYLQGCESSDWKVRLQSMGQVSQVCFQHGEALLQHRSCGRVVDVLSKQINDPNVKVALNALRVFQELTRQLPSLIESSLSVILNEVFICFSASKPEIRAAAEEFFDTISASIEKWMLTQHMCNGALYSVQKSKPVIVEKLTRLVPALYKSKPGIFQKNVYGMVNKLAEEGRAELLGPLRGLLEAIYTEVGEECMSALRQRAKSLIFE